MTFQELCTEKALNDPESKIYKYTQQIWDIAWNSALESTKPKEESIPFKEIIEATNEVLGKKYRLIEMYKGHIRARWGEGMRLEDFRRVCEVMFAEWDSDPAMRPYLRPETLYNTKMQSYLMREVKKTRQIEPDWL